MCNFYILFNFVRVYMLFSFAPPYHELVSRVSKKLFKNNGDFNFSVF